MFRVLVFVRRTLYAMRILRRTRAGVPVIAIGNLTVGGSGKTPLAIHVAELLRSKGWSPAIVSRGYGGSASAPRAATLASDPADVGDEPVLMARRAGCPVWVGADRASAVALLRQAHPECDVVILDDGLQHYALARDLEIAVVDARGFGNGFLLPAGPLREPRTRLGSVDAVLAHDTERPMRVSAGRWLPSPASACTRSPGSATRSASSGTWRGSACRRSPTRFPTTTRFAPPTSSSATRRRC